MAFTRDVQNVGRGQGASGTPTISTSAAAASGARVFAVVIMDAAAGTVTADSMSGGSPTGGWIRIGTAQDASKSSCVGAFYGDFPSGLASSTSLTVAVTGSHFDWTMVASSYLGSGWTQNGATDTKSQISGTTWVSNTLTLPGAGIVVSCAGYRTAGGTDTNTPASGSTEDNDANNSVSGSGEEIAIIESRIETVGAGYTNGGTLVSTATDGGTVFSTAWSEGAAAAAVVAYQPHRMPLGV